ncbi:MAG: PH domain-containing protein [Planctomycetota bacterium]|nr:MAG: PH domain-containing protein [Planctomycetota bacterium]REK27293.1 MAG: PH domain-containing protein [Planctomycetota bacterium]REK36686.1 MAG: PH domain-containing protein [Planctomycetota bacterium]
MLKTLLVNAILMVGGILGIAVGVVGVGNWTAVACVVVVALWILLYLLAALRQRPRVVLTAEGLTFEKLFGRESHQWDEIDGSFVVIKIGWNDAVAYKLTPESKARLGKKSSALYSGYDAAVVGSALPRSAGELAALLNEYKQSCQASGRPASPEASSAEPGAAPDTGGL